jgi:hypothetical protein
VFNAVNVNGVIKSIVDSRAMSLRTLFLTPVILPVACTTSGSGGRGGYRGSTTDGDRSMQAAIVVATLL